MARVAEDMARVATEIVADRKQRRDFLAEIKIATGHRQSDVESFLQNARSARGKATKEQAEHRRKTAKARNADVFSTLLSLQTSRGRAASVQAAEGKKMTRELHDEVRSMLRDQKASRIRTARDNHKEAVDTNSRRRGEVRAMLDQFARDGVARRQSLNKFAEAQRKRAKAFVIDLTDGVDAFRDKLARDGRDRAAEIRDHLSTYARDRREGMAIWRGNFQKSRTVKEQPRRAAHSVIVQSAAAPAPRHEPAASPTAPADTQFAAAPSPGHEPAAASTATADIHGATADFATVECPADKAKSPQSASGRQPARQPQGRQGGHTK